MQTAKLPYEFLVRWDKDGKLAGAHVQWRYVTMDGVKVVAEGVTNPETVDIGDGKGFPLQDILSQTQTDALAQLAQAEARLSDAEASLTAALAARDAA